MKYLIIDKRPRVGEKEIPTASERIMEELGKKNIEYDFIFNDQLQFIFMDGKMEIHSVSQKGTQFVSIVSLT